MITPLLATKTYVPTPRPTLVTRPRLIERLDAGLDRKLTLVSAPAGFGKTTLVSEWLQRTAHPAAWLSLGRGDNDPVQFWRYVVAALQTIDETIGETAQAALQTSQPPPSETLIATLLNDCVASGNERQDGPYVLVLDDYHVIESQPIHDGLNFLLDNLPPQLYPVIITRQDPPLALPRRRGRLELTEIRVADLRFTVEETAEFLNTLLGLSLSPEDVSALEGRTEGWAVGLQMAALSLQERTPLERHDFVTVFAGDDRYIVDYLVQEVFQRQPPHIQAFLRQTAVLERLCGPLCDAVTGGNDGQETLNYLEQANLFTIPLDNRRYWYRYHQLFADLLRHRLDQSEDTRRIDTLYHRASVWCQQEGLITEAVSYALAASDLEYAATVIERYVLDVFFHSEIALIHHWLQALPDGLIRSHPLLQAVYASTRMLLAGFSADSVELAGHWIQEAERTLAAQGRDAGEAPPSTGPTHDEVAGFISNIRAYLSRFRGDAPRTVLALSQQALDRLPQDDLRFRSALLTNLGYTHQILGDDDAASHAFAQARRIGELSDDLFNAAAATRAQGQIARKRGRLHEAAAISREYLDLIGGGARGRLIPYAGVVYITLGDILLEWNDLEEAERILTRGLNLGKLFSQPIAANGYIALARLRQAQGNLARAFELLEQAEQLQPTASSQASADHAGLLPRWAEENPTAISSHVAAYRSRLWLTQARDDPDKLARAARWASERQIVLESEHPYSAIEHLEQTTLYRLLIAQRRAQGSPDLSPLLDCLDVQLDFAREKTWDEWAIELLLLRALALHAQGSLPQAIVSLRQALALAEPGGYVRIFLDEGPPVQQLLYEIVARNPATGYANRLLEAAFDGTEPRPQARPASPGVLVETLSSRELEVLQLVAAGHSNPEIAQGLFVTVGTVKKHLTHVFGKLGVKNRTQAAARARDLGLLE